MESAPNPAARLAFFFERNGYLRLPDPERHKSDAKPYKKGYEVRLVAYDSSELEEIRELLSEAGFKLANSHAKGNRQVQPIYGKGAVERFCELCGREFPADNPDADS